MPSIYLVRHGEYDNPRNILPGRLPIELSAGGRQQAERLRDYFSNKPVGVIYSSAVERCKQTSEIIANGSIPITYDPRLLETFSAYQGYWGDNRHDGGFHFFSHHEDLGGETVADIHRRVADFWDSVVLSSSNDIIVCSHGDPLYLLYCHLTNTQLPSEREGFGTPETYLAKGGFMEIILENGTVQEIKPQRML